MATGKHSHAPASRGRRPITPATATPFLFIPPDDAVAVELDEFWKPGIGDVLIGPVTRVSERPDPAKPEQMMRSLHFAPALVIDAANDGERTVFGSLACGLSAHLGLLIQFEQAAGKKYAIRYDGNRPGDKGKQPSKQFSVWELSDKALDAEFAKAPADEQEPLPF